MLLPLASGSSKNSLLRFEPDQYGSGLLRLSCLPKRAMPAARETWEDRQMSMSLKLCLGGAIILANLGSASADFITYMELDQLQAGTYNNELTFATLGDPGTYTFGFEARFTTQAGLDYTLAYGDPDNFSVIFSGHMVNTSGTIGFDTLAGTNFGFFQDHFEVTAANLPIYLSVSGSTVAVDGFTGGSVIF